MYTESANKMRITITICGFLLQVEDSTYNLRNAPTVADSAKAQFTFTIVLLYVCGFHKPFWISKNGCGIRKFAYFWSYF